MDGIAFYEEVRRRNPAQADRIILVTAHVQIDQYQEFMQTVRAPILQKPFTLGAAPVSGRLAPAPRHAQLAVNLAGSMTSFLATWEARKNAAT